MADRFSGKVALVTGAGSGIGRAAALAFAKEGAKVVVSDIDTAGGEATVAAILRKDGEARFVRTDVSDAAEVEAMVAAAVEAYGRLDCAYNNAGIEGPGGIAHLYDESAWLKVIQVNLVGTWLCMKYELPVMLAQGGGAIVNAGSIAGLVASPANGTAYTASKHGVIGLTKAAALEYAKDHIRINAVCPGPIRTSMTERMGERRPQFLEQAAQRSPSGRMGTADEVAQAVLWLASDAASFTTGATLTVDGGFVAQ
ncbi:MAG: SDR family oxidoreductase [Dehalococcoidia bacterium]|nr:SDR family oxidoreductase [Dehalococcoidia bacterium]